MFGGSSSTTGNALQLQNIPQADTQAFNMASNLASSNPLTQLLPLYNQATSSIINNPNASSMISGGNTAMGIGQTAALGGAGASNSLYGYGNQILQTGFDPQSQLYNRTQQQVADQLRAANYASGVGSSPYGAGVEGQGLSNFNMDWQNNQLNRQSTALTGAEGAFNSALDLGTKATGLYTQASSIPYEILNSISQDKLGALDAQSNALTNERNVSNQGLQDLYQYLSLGNQYQQTGIQQQGQNLNSSEAMTGAIGSGLGALVSFLGMF